LEDFFINFFLLYNEYHDHCIKILNPFGDLTFKIVEVGFRMFDLAFYLNGTANRITNGIDDAEIPS